MPLGRKHILVIGPGHIPSLTIGILQPLEYLRKRREVQLDVRSEQEVSSSTIAAADIVVFSRSTRQEALHLLETANAKGKHTIYVIDDHFLAMPPWVDMGKTMQNSEVRQVCTRFINQSKIVKVASEFFTRHLKTHFQPKKVVCFPGSVDFAVIDQVKASDRDTGKIVLGYSGGRKESSFKIVAEALRQVKQKYGDQLVFEFFRYEPHEVRKMGDVRHKRYRSDYRDYLRELASCHWDIGIAPLERTLFHDCKTNNKYREYAACGIPGVYSDSPAYADWVRHKETGILVKHTVDGWTEGLIQMIEDESLRRRIKQQAENEARRHFTIEDCAKKWQEKLIRAS